MPTALSSLNHWLVLLIACGIVFFGLGVAVSTYLAKRSARQKRRAPKQWPLTQRAIINSEERRSWRWLELAFVDYTVMVKMPVTRFSAPNSKEQGLYWYELLSSLYCSFTVVAANGRVVGCVDLPSRTGEKTRSHRMKAALLAQCGIPYLLLQNGVQPTIAQLRLRFLGDAAPMPQSSQQADAVHAASSSLRNSISRNRQTRPPSTRPQPLQAPDYSNSFASEFADVPSSGFSAPWQDDSFIMPLDSRSAPLKN